MSNTRMRLRVTRGVYAIGALAAAFFVASRTTGAGWLTVLLAVAVGILIIGAVGPILAARHGEIEAWGPRDAVAGRPFDLTIGIEGNRQYVHVRTTAPLSDWLGAVVPVSGAIRTVADRRGVITEVDIEIATASPLGLFRVNRRYRVTLPEPIAVAPRVEPVSLATATTAPADGSAISGRRTGTGETVRSIRDYQEGDSLRMIHWPTTARMNHPVVKELESPDAPHLIIVLDLNCSVAESDRRASVAYGHVQRGLAAGVPIRLLTAEATGPHGGAVGSMLEAGRRLARATYGRPAEVPTELTPITVVHIP